MAGASALVSPVRADEYPTVNGLPCGALCRMWMGIKAPAAESAERETDPAPRPPIEIHAAPQPPQARAPHPEPRKSADPAVAHRGKDNAPASGSAGKLDAAAKPQLARDAEKARPGAKGAKPSPDRPTLVQAPPVALKTQAPVALSASPAPEPTSTAVREIRPETPTVAAPGPRGATKSADSDRASAPPALAAAPPDDAGKPQPPQTTKVSSAAPEIASLDREGQGRRIAIVLTSLEVKDVADLHDKSVVLAGAMNISDARLKAAFATAGAAGAVFRKGEVGDADEVVNGGAAAAILAVVAPDIAGAFPEIPGYRLLRVEVVAEAAR